MLSSYHFSMQVIGRSSGRSAVAAAAYRAGERLVDEGRGTVADYSRRRGVVHTEILAPDRSPAWLQDRSQLWNAVERMEGRRDAQLAREINLALPHELPEMARLQLVRRFVEEEFVSQGMVADIAIHRPVPERGEDSRNHHAHIMLTLRRATADGLDAVKTRAWNSESMLRKWRAAWATHQNAMLRDQGHGQQIDHRSLPAQRADAKRQGDKIRAAILDRKPEIHVGPHATALGRQGRPSIRMRENHDRIASNIAHHRRRTLYLQNRSAQGRAVLHLRGRRTNLLSVVSVDRAMRDRAWQAHLKQRQLERLLRDIDRLLAGLMRHSNLQLIRQYELARALTPRRRPPNQRARRGRGRQRLRRDGPS